FEAQIQLLMEIGAANRRAFLTPRIALAREDVGKEIAECRRRRSVHGHREVEAFESVRDRLGLAGISARAVPAPPIRLAERFVRFGYLAELRGGHPVTGVDVRMEFPRKTLVGPLDVADRRASFNSEDDVEIHRLSTEASLRRRLRRR